MQRTSKFKHTLNGLKKNLDDFEEKLVSSRISFFDKRNDILRELEDQYTKHEKDEMHNQYQEKFKKNMELLKDFKNQEQIESTLEVKLLNRILENYNIEDQEEDQEKSVHSDESDNFDFQDIPFWEDEEAKRKKFLKLKDQNLGEETPEGFIIIMGEKYKDNWLCEKILMSPLGKRIILKIKTLQDEIKNLNHKIKQNLKSFGIQKKLLASKIETQTRDFYVKRVKEFLQEVRKEIKVLLSQMTRTKMESECKDKIVIKLAQAIIRQDEFISEIRSKVMNKEFDLLSTFAFECPVKIGGLLNQQAQSYISSVQLSALSSLGKVNKANIKRGNQIALVKGLDDENVRRMNTAIDQVGQQPMSNDTLTRYISSINNSEFNNDDILDENYRSEMSFSFKQGPASTFKPQGSFKKRKQVQFQNKFDDGNLEYQKQNSEQFDQINSQFQMLQDLAENWFEEKIQLEEKIESLQQNQSVIKEQNHSKQVELEIELNMKQVEHEKEIKELRAKFEKYRDQIEKEFELKEVIQQRLQRYIESQKKEIAIAKNILKCPRWHEQVSRKMNFDEIVLYKYENTQRSSSVIEKREPIDKKQEQEDIKQTILTKLEGKNLELTPLIEPRSQTVDKRKQHQSYSLQVSPVSTDKKIYDKFLKQGEVKKRIVFQNRKNSVPKQWSHLCSSPLSQYPQISTNDYSDPNFRNQTPTHAILSIKPKKNKNKPQLIYSNKQQQIETIVRLPSTSKNSSTLNETSISFF